MTFQEAKDKLKTIANGRYHSIAFDLTEYESGELAAECSLYVNDSTHYRGPTWEAAFIAMERGFDGISESEAMEMAPK